MNNFAVNIKGGAKCDNSKHLCQASSLVIKFCQNVALKATDPVLNVPELLHIPLQNYKFIKVTATFKLPEVHQCVPCALSYQDKVLKGVHSDIEYCSLNSECTEL